MSQTALTLQQQTNVSRVLVKATVLKLYDLSLREKLKKYIKFERL